jgi:hypothetical protein
VEKMLRCALPRGETREKIGVVNSKYGIFRQKIPKIPKNSKKFHKFQKIPKIPFQFHENL